MLLLFEVLMHYSQYSILYSVSKKTLKKQKAIRLSKLHDCTRKLSHDSCPEKGEKEICETFM